MAEKTHFQSKNTSVYRITIKPNFLEKQRTSCLYRVFSFAYFLATSRT